MEDLCPGSFEIRICLRNHRDQVRWMVTRDELTQAAGVCGLAWADQTSENVGGISSWMTGAVVWAWLRMGANYGVGENRNGSCWSEGGRAVFRREMTERYQMG